MSPSRRQLLKLSTGALASAGLHSHAKNETAAPRFHPTEPDTHYKCLFNHELLIIVGKKDNNPEYIGSFIDKLKDTDVDALMCCPTMWRTNLYPSEVDPQWKKFTPEHQTTKFPAFDRIMAYIHGGGDPVRDTLEACRRNGKAFFLSYRMNDHHYIGDLTWPTHNAFWREHPEYWLGNSELPASKAGDEARLFNYLLPEVRDHYFSILHELCSNYDVDGVELDFQRYPKFFRDADLKTGSEVMTAFLHRIQSMMEDIGGQRGKTLKLCVRIPETLAKCTQAGLDIAEWDKRKLVDMFNISPSYIHSIELGIEEFRSVVRHGKIYGEMNYVTYQVSGSEGKTGRRYTTFETYRGSALNLFHRGVDGLSLFNYDYVPYDKRVDMAKGLKHITDQEFLRKASKNYVISSGFGTFPATNESSIDLVIPDDTSQVKFDRAILRVETRSDSSTRDMGVRLNGQSLKPLAHEGTELFPRVAENLSHPAAETVKFFTVPLNRIITGLNKIEISNLDLKKGNFGLRSMELALYR